MKTVFNFKEGARLSGDAQLIGEALVEVETKRGALTPRNVLDEARTDASPLHSFFEWNDSKAAEAHRLQQAGHLIRSITVVIESETAESEPAQLSFETVASAPAQKERAPTVRAFVPVTLGENESPVYVATTRAMCDPALRTQVLARAHGELDSVARKYRELREFGEVFSALDRVGQLLREVGSLDIGQAG